MRPTAKWAVRISLGLVAVGGVVVFAGYRKAQPGANVGVGYVAHQLCSCIFVAGRSHDSCRPDMLPAMEAIQSQIVQVEERSGVRAWVPLLASRIAVHTPGLGCSLD